MLYYVCISIMYVQVLTKFVDLLALQNAQVYIIHVYVLRICTPGFQTKSRALRDHLRALPFLPHICTSTFCLTFHTAGKAPAKKVDNGPPSNKPASAGKHTVTYKHVSQTECSRTTCPCVCYKYSL